MSNRNIPELPNNQIIVSEQIELRVEGWKTYLRNISPRVILVDPEETLGFKDWYDRAYKYLTEELKVPTEHGLTYWPKKVCVAFFVGINISTDRIIQKTITADYILFCFDGTAFPVRIFNWYEGCNWPSFCITEYNKSSLSWTHTLPDIVEAVKKVENAIPEPPLPSSNT